MPEIVKQPEDAGGVARIFCEDEARRIVRAGTRKWMELRDQIDTIVIGRKRFYSETALNAFLRRQTKKARTASHRNESRPAGAP